MEESLCKQGKSGEQRNERAITLEKSRSDVKTISELHYIITSIRVQQCSARPASSSRHYGCTCDGVAGKTFTMEGVPENRGVNFRALEELFRVARERESHTEYRCVCGNRYR